MSWRDASQHITDEHLTFEGFSLDDAFISGWTRGLASAPAIGGWVWCEASAWEHIPGEPINLDSFAPCRNGDCPGPHRTLLLGPEVEA